jgi:hypothetical protein
VKNGRCCLEGSERAEAPGPFAAAALDLRQFGLFVFPLGGEKGNTPLIRHFTKIRRPSLATLARWARRHRFADIAILTGIISRILVIDVDSDDPLILRRIEDRFGEALIKVGTPRGGCHLYYRYAGEPTTNLRREGLPVDIKGQGGYVVAPPSVRRSGDYAGRRYELVKGSWADLPQLTPIEPASLPQKLQQTVSEPYRGSSARIVRLRAVGEGHRNNVLFAAALRQALTCRSEQELLEAGIEINATAFKTPLGLPEVTKTIRSAWGYEVRGENLAGRRRDLTSSESDAALAAEHPDAYDLLRVLRRANGGCDARGEPFPASPRAMAKAGTIPEWGTSRRHYIRALAVLVQLGFLRIVHKGGRRPGDARLFRFHKGGPSMQPRLVISTPSSTIDIDLMRVVEALKSGLSIRKASKALRMDKSKILRLKRRAEVLKLIGVSQVETPCPEISHSGLGRREEVSQQAADPGVSVRRAVSTNTPPAAAPPPSLDGVAMRQPGNGCLLNLPDRQGGYHLCGRPVGPDGIFCCDHGVPGPVGPQKIAPKPQFNFSSLNQCERFTPAARG